MFSRDSKPFGASPSGLQIRMLSRFPRAAPAAPACPGLKSPSLTGKGFRCDAAAPLYYVLMGFTDFPIGRTRMLPAEFLPFIEQRPIGVMARAIVERFFEPDRLDA